MATPVKRKPAASKKTAAKSARKTVAKKAAAKKITATKTGARKNAASAGKGVIGVVGMAVMGRNLALNIESRGHVVSIFNRSREKTDEVLKDNPGAKFVPSYTIEKFVASLEKPRRILLMVQAGAGTDAVIAELKPLLSKGDVLIDGGNTFSRTPSGVTRSWPRPASTSSARAFPAVRRARCTAHPSCPAVRAMRTIWSNPSSPKSPPKRLMARRAWPIWATTAPAIT